MTQLKDALDALVADAPLERKSWNDVQARTHRRRRGRFAVFAIAVAMVVVVFVTPGFGAAKRVLGLFEGTPVPAEQLSDDDLHAMAAMTHGVSPRVPSAREDDLKRLGVAPLRQIATRGGRAFYAATRSGGGLCVSVGLVGAADPIGDILCASDFPSATRPLLDRSIFVGTPKRPSVARLEGFAADGVAQVGLLTATGDVTALTPVRDNVYTRSEGIPSSSIAGLVALDNAGKRIYSACITGPCPSSQGATK